MTPPPPHGWDSPYPLPESSHPLGALLPIPIPIYYPSWNHPPYALCEYDYEYINWIDGLPLPSRAGCNGGEYRSRARRWACVDLAVDDEMWYVEFLEEPDNYEPEDELDGGFWDGDDFDQVFADRDRTPRVPEEQVEGGVLGSGSVGVEPPSARKALGLVGGGLTVDRSQANSASIAPLDSSDVLGARRTDLRVRARDLRQINRDARTGLRVKKARGRTRPGTLDF